MFENVNNSAESINMINKRSIQQSVIKLVIKICILCSL